MTLWPLRRSHLAATAAIIVASIAFSATAPVPTESVPLAVPTTQATATPSPSPTVTLEPEPVGPPAPLTGLPTLAASTQRRVLAVKIDNHANARPQTGLNVADGVMELPVESGLTRFIALFHSTDLAAVGPVRSGRPTDPTVVRPLRATFLISGAQPWIVSLIRNMGVPLVVDIGEGVTFRSSDRFAPHNLYADTMAVRSMADARGIDDDPPPAWFNRDESPPGVQSSTPRQPVALVTLPWSDQTTVTWNLSEQGTWLRTHNGAEHETLGPKGVAERIAVDHLVILQADRYTARSPVDGGGLPALRTTGSGNAWVIVGGDSPTVTHGTWARSSASDLPILSDATGQEMHVPPGRLWVSWFPSNRTPRFDAQDSSKTGTRTNDGAV